MLIAIYSQYLTGLSNGKYTLTQIRLSKLEENIEDVFIKPTHATAYFNNNIYSQFFLISQRPWCDT